MSNYPDWLKLVNCAQCNRELCGESMQGRVYGAEFPPLVRGRIKGRPYCGLCLEVRPIPERADPSDEDENPWQQLSLRRLEDL
jgi:hypothetical protein